MIACLLLHGLAIIYNKARQRGIPLYSSAQAIASRLLRAGEELLSTRRTAAELRISRPPRDYAEVG